MLYRRSKEGDCSVEDRYSRDLFREVEKNHEDVGTFRRATHPFVPI